MRKTTLLRALCLAFALLLCAALLPASAPAAAAGDVYEWENPETGFRVVVQDELGLLTHEERLQLMTKMAPVTAYGHAAFWSTDAMTYDEVEQARLKRRSLFERESAAILVINMNVRTVTVQSDGEINTVVTKGRADTITNNVRNYLTRGEYLEGASIAFGQIETLMEHDRIPQPMKYLSAFCIALLISLMLMLRVVIRSARANTRPRRQPVREAAVNWAFSEPELIEQVHERLYRSSSGGGGSGCFGCGGGGGGSSRF